MSETHISSGPSGRHRGLRWALIASLALNLLLIGVLAGGVMRYAQRPPVLTMQTDYRSLWRALPGDARAQLRETARDGGFAGGARPHRGPEERRAALARMNAQIIAVLRGQPFDAEGFAALLDGERDALERRMLAVRAAFVARVAALTAAERAAMADELERVWADRLPRR